MPAARMKPPQESRRSLSVPEGCRFSTSVKYRVEVSQLHLTALSQFGGYDPNSGSNGAYPLQAGGDIGGAANGMLSLSLDAVGSYVRDAVLLGLSGNPTINGVPVPTFLPLILTATISDDSTMMLLGYLIPWAIAPKPDSLEIRDSTDAAARRADAIRRCCN